MNAKLFKFSLELEIFYDLNVKCSRQREGQAFGRVEAESTVTVSHVVS